MTDEERAEEIVAPFDVEWMEPHSISDGPERDHPHSTLETRIAAALSRARAEERERCARLAEEHILDGINCDGGASFDTCLEEIARAIRRGE